MTVCISTRNLSKQYTISHRENYPYLSAREEIVNSTKKIFSYFSGNKSRSNNIDEKFWALKDINLEVQQGERIGIIGKNGSGKSTLLKLLSRITAPTRGEIKIRGSLTSLLEVGTGFHPELTGRENIYLNGAILGMNRKDITNKFDEIVAFAEIEKFLDTPVKRYSSGMYVRLAFAVAAHLEPDILVVDEVLAVGDFAFQKKCLQRVKEVSDEGRTIIIVSHNLESIKPLCERGIFLEKGVLIEDGLMSSVASSYTDLHDKKYYSMSSYTSREGIGGVEIVNVYLSNNGQYVFNSNDAMVINIKAKVSKKYQNGKQIDIGVGIDNLNGRRIFTGVSSWVDSNFFISSEYLEVECILDSLPLVAGRYLVSVSLINNNKLLDCIVHCSEFNVVDLKQKLTFTTRNSLHGELIIPYNFIDKGA